MRKFESTRPVIDTQGPPCPWDCLIKKWVSTKVCWGGGCLCKTLQEVFREAPRSPVVAHSTPMCPHTQERKHAHRKHTQNWNTARAKRVINDRVERSRSPCFLPVFCDMLSSVKHAENNPEGVTTTSQMREHSIERVRQSFGVLGRPRIVLGEQPKVSADRRADLPVASGPRGKKFRPTQCFAPAPISTSPLLPPSFSVRIAKDQAPWLPRKLFRSFLPLPPGNKGTFILALLVISFLVQ